MPVQADHRLLDLQLRSNGASPADTFSLSGRTQVHPSVIGARAVNLVTLGQSNNNNSISGTYSATHGSNVYNCAIAHRGALFVAAKPLLVSDLTDDHHKRKLADDLITDGLVDDVIITMASLGGSASSAWAASGALHYRISLAARCIYAGGIEHVPRIIDWIQGEADTDASVNQATYQANLQAVIDQCKRSGLLRPGTDKMIVHRCTRLTGTGAIRDGIRAAQVAVCDGVDVIQGADIDTLTGASNRPDGTHFSLSPGMTNLVALIKPYFADLL